MAKILVLGVTGMLGHTLFKIFSEDSQYDAWGSMRSASGLRFFTAPQQAKLMTGVDVLDADALSSLLAQVQPDVVINCIGLIKQLSDANDPLHALPINSMLPHRLANLCALGRSRLVHFSTDCVFSGRQGGYSESDVPDAEDLYGKSKHIGEVQNQDHVFTLRTSIIGHELNSSYALVDWFLAQQGSVKGFAKAIFSGLPTLEVAQVVKDYVLPRPQLSGVYHVAAQPISKLELLRLVAEVYQKDIEIRPDESLVIDRSLDASRFNEATGYSAPAWRELINKMHAASTKDEQGNHV